jgi:hypothetical protein
MYDTHTPAEWVEFLSLGVAIPAAVSVPFFLFVDADLADFDPRPAVRRALETDAGVRLLVEITRARHAAHDALRDAALTVAALLAFLTITPGETR